MNKDQIVPEIVRQTVATLPFALEIQPSPVEKVEAVHNFLHNSVDRIAKYISNIKYISKMNEKNEYCVICLNCKECTSNFLSLPFCKQCEMHLYNGDIDISKSMKEHCICWTNEKRPIYDKDSIHKHIKESLILCKNKVTQCLDKMENNNDDIEHEIRACHAYIEKAFYFVSR